MNNFIASSSYWLTRFQIGMMSPYSKGVVNTCRPFAYYRKVFFEGQSSQVVLASLKNHKILDVGCGYTPYVKDSMFRACHDAGIEFYGIDPKIEQNKQFNNIDVMVAGLTGGSGCFDADAPGLDKAIAARAENLPFENSSVDMILSCWLMLIWIDKEEDLFSIFTEFHRVLKWGGKVSIYPLPDWDSLRFESAELKAILDEFTYTQYFIYEPFNLLYPSANRVTFSKKQ
jgi:SAM-dependent methyltransferase